MTPVAVVSPVLSNLLSEPTANTLPLEPRPAAAHVLGRATVDDNMVIITADNNILFLALILLHLNYIT